MHRIALIDDSRIDRRYVSACLREYGYMVDEILPYQVSQVVAVLNSRVPDLILLDYSIPGCSGADIARACQADPRLREVPVVVITAHQDSSSRLEIAQIEPAGILQKPCKQVALLSMVRRTLGTTAELPVSQWPDPLESETGWVPWKPLTA